MITDKEKQQIIHDACQENDIRECICTACKKERKLKEIERNLIKAEAKGCMEGYVMGKGYDWLEECVKENWVANPINFSGSPIPSIGNFPIGSKPPEHLYAIPLPMQEDPEETFKREAREQVEIFLRGKKGGIW